MSALTVPRQMGATWWTSSVVRGKGLDFVLWAMENHWRIRTEHGDEVICSVVGKMNTQEWRDEKRYVASHPDRRWDVHKRGIRSTTETAQCFRGRVDRTWLFIRYGYLRVGSARQERMKDDTSYSSLSIWVASVTRNWDRQHRRWSSCTEGKAFCVEFLLSSIIFLLASHLSTVSDLWRSECGSPVCNPSTPSILGDHYALNSVLAYDKGVIVILGVLLLMFVYY